MSAVPSSVFPGNVPTSSSGTAGNVSITFTLGASPGDPNAIIFGDESNPLVGSLLEIPASLESLGGTQSHAIHLFPGGFKTVQALGAFPHALQWEGMLLTGNASARSFQLDTWRRNGQTAYLALGPWLWKGLVTSYEAPFRHQNLIHYRMSFEPTQDLSAAAPATTAAGSSMNSLLQQINSQGSTSPLSSNSLNALVAFSQAVTSFVQQAISAITALTSAEQLVVSQAQSVVIAALNIDAASTNLATSIAAVNMQGVVNTLVAGILATQIQTTVTLINPNLATLAAQYLGDASRWEDIATLNGLSDLEPVGILTLSIPSI
jgi:uncharacterized protein YaaR (DUF327 family)